MEQTLVSVLINQNLPETPLLKYFFRIWWVSEILGACLSVIVVRLFFAPLYSEDKSSSPLWWWRWYQSINSPVIGFHTKLPVVTEFIVA